MADPISQYSAMSQISESGRGEIESFFIYGTNASNVMIIEKNKSIFMYGDNERGSLGLGTTSPHITYEGRIKLPLNENILSISSGLRHVIVLTNTGNIYSWGRNRQGALGDGTTVNKYKPIQVLADGFPQFIAVHCGYYHSSAICKNGNLYFWGNNHFGQIGNDSCNNLLRPKIVISEIQAVCCGENHSLALGMDGQVYSWGYNKFGQLGILDKKFSAKPLKVVLNTVIKKIFCGRNHNLLLSQEDNVYTFGKNNMGQIGNNTLIDQFEPFQIRSSYRLIDIAASLQYDISACLSEEGIFLIWGGSNKGVISICPIKSHFSSFHEIFAKHGDVEITYKMILLGENKLIKEVQYKKFRNDFINFGFFMENRNWTLCRARNIEDETIYVLKKVIIEKSQLDYVYEEFEKIRALKNKNIIYYKTLWVEGNGNSSMSFSLYIQMENFQRTLKSLISEINGKFSDNSLNSSTVIRYCIAGRLLVQIIEACDYLNKKKFSILESSLTTSNIFITIDCITGIVIKLANLESSILSIINKKSFKESYLRRMVDISMLKNLIEELFNMKVLKELLSNKNHFISKKARMIEEIMYSESQHSIRSSLLMIKEKLVVSFDDINLSVESLKELSKYFPLSMVKENTKSLHLDIRVFNFKYLDEFELIERIGRGGVGAVCKVRKKVNKEIYAIKMVRTIENLSEDAYNELRVLADLKGEKVVNYYDAWIENNLNDEINFENHRASGLSSSIVYDPNLPLVLHIQMEYCIHGDLRGLIERMAINTNMVQPGFMTPVRYYIANELFMEILEGVDFLHKQNPPIIHRDLKPSNIMITDGIQGFFVKIGDFGSSKYLESEECPLSLPTATKGYIAPEVLAGERYDTHADIFSLGVIAQDLFKFNINEEISQNIDTLIRKKFVELIKISNQMRQLKANDRPDCMKVKELEELWYVDIDQLNSNDEFLEIINQPHLSHENLAETKFPIYFLQKKSIIKRNKKYKLENNLINQNRILFVFVIFSFFFAFFYYFKLFIILDYL